MKNPSLETAVADYRRRTAVSAALYERARSHFPAGSTRSASFFDPYPLYLERGQGARVWDVDGTERTDFDSNYTVLVHGHGFGPIVEAVTAQAARATCFASPTSLELTLAEMIKGRLPSIEQMRFTSSGTEASLVAVRGARAFTGREKVAKFVGGYHGSGDFAAIQTPWQYGGGESATSLRTDPDGPGVTRAVTEAAITLPFNDIDGVRRILAREAKDVALVIVEPVLGAGGLIPAERAFLAALREITAELKILLAFDEVITFRLGYGGAQGLYDVTPDLTLLGKIIGGGLPVGAVGGRRDVLSVFDITAPGTIRHSGTYNANPMTAAAGIACLSALDRASFARMSALSNDLGERCRALISDRGIAAAVSVVESLFNVQAVPRVARQHSELLAHDKATLRTIHLGLLNAGVLLTPSGMGCVSTVTNAADVDAFVDGLRFALDRYFV
jgi:glutamate-1-semialdehyde 2,1-aminomutase